MKLRPEDHRWLADSYPDLLHDSEATILVGEIDFCASFDASSGKLHIGTDAAGSHPSYLCDFFAIRVELDAVGHEGWPKVYETGGRRQEIAEHEGVHSLDLHFYNDTTCCLGLRAAPERHLTIDGFLRELVIPFFYRLSYVDKHGISAARADLWGEYPHDDAGIHEYEWELVQMGRRSPKRNDPCPCGKGQKYKRCHLDEVRAIMSRLARPPQF